MKVTIVSVGGTPTVHKAGCAHLNRLESTRGVRYDIEVGSAAEAASDFWTDLIAEGSMTEEEALSETRFAPCVSTLPTAVAS